jgi:hypothetical protein
MTTPPTGVRGVDNVRQLLSALSPDQKASMWGPLCVHLCVFSCMLLCVCIVAITSEILVV